LSPPANSKPVSQLVSLAGKSAIVTGGAAGLGFAITARLAEAGAAVLIADSDIARARLVAEELKTHNFTVSAFKCDVSREDDVRSLAEKAATELESIDILVNNAGIYPRKALSEMTAPDFEHVIAVNLTGTFLCSRFIAEKMIAQKREGCIINIASVEALHPGAGGMTAYDASKGGVLSLTKSLAKELGSHGIRVNAILPGAILTDAVRAHFSSEDKASANAQFKELKAFMRRMVLGRLGDPDDIARVALFLASELSSYITGTMIVVDGGYLIG